IGLAWLAYNQGTTDLATKIKPKSGPLAKEPTPPPEKTVKLAWRDRFRGGLPPIDTGGYAEKALDHVRMNDPHGALADKASMAIADFYYAVGDYETAGQKYDQLVAMHPHSPLVPRAQLASIDSKLKGYLGPEYDGAGLEQAKETITQTRVLFPERA